MYNHLDIDHGCSTGQYAIKTAYFISIFLLFIFSIWGSLHVCIFNVIVLLLTISHVRASFSDPGKMGSEVRHPRGYSLINIIIIHCINYI